MLTISILVRTIMIIWTIIGGPIGFLVGYRAAFRNASRIAAAEFNLVTIEEPKEYPTPLPEPPEPSQAIRGTER